MAKPKPTPPARTERPALNAQTKLEISIAHARGIAFLLARDSESRQLGAAQLDSPELRGFAIGALETLLADAEDALNRMTEEAAK